YHNGNLTRGRAFVIGAEEARQDPNIVTGTFTLNNHYATTLFDSGADYSFVSTTSIHLLDIEPSNLGFSYEIEIASGQLVEINKFLGHVINNDGLHVESRKLKAVKNWEAPRTPSEVRLFLGLARYYRRFIVNFSKLAKPLTILTQKHKDEYDYEIRYHLGKENVVADALSRYERIKPKRVRAMNMTVQSSIQNKILAAQNEACII
nr:putative reverse transcriptase domain-containing protein [Tanacetum cinerariifolium]